MDELRALISALTPAGITQDINVEAFYRQSFASVVHLDNIITLSKLPLKFKSIRSFGLLHPGDIPFYITALVII